MPGLNQLKKFSADILQMGNEVERRRRKGETLPRIPFPENASEADDSGQFVLGLPQEGDFTTETDSVTTSIPGEEEEEIDIQALLANALAEQNGQQSAPAAEPVPEPAEEPVPEPADSGIPSLDDDNLFGDISDIGSSDGALDALADFEADTSGLFTDPAFDDLTAMDPAPAAAQADATPGFDFASPATDTGFSSGTAASDPFGDIGSLDGFDSFLKADEPAAAPTGADPLSDFDFGTPAAESAEPAAPSEPADFDFSGTDFSFPDSGASIDAAGSSSGFDDFSFGADDVASLDTLDDAGLDSASDFETAEPERTPSAINDEFAISDDTQFMDMNMDIPEGLQEGPGAEPDPLAGMGELDFGAASGDISNSGFEPVSTEDSGADTAGLSDFDSADAAEPVSLDDFGSSGTADDSFSLDSISDFSSDMGFGEPASDAAPAIDDAGSFAEAAPDDGSSGFDFGSLGELGELDTLDSGASSETMPEDPLAAFPADSGSDGFNMPDFDLGGGSPGGLDDFDLPPVDGIDVMDLQEGAGADSSGFEPTDDDFSIPGFSDFDMIPQEAGPAKKEEKVTQKRKDEPAPLKTELTDAEYKRFLENLDYYPLNVRLALQDMIVKNEFTDDTVMDVINKVIKKIPARQLAAHLEKLLDVSLPVPINYEKRTAAEYEAYKKSLAYQLRNKIIPVTIASVLSIVLCVLFGWLIAKFVVTPVKAELLYKEGYELISNGMYPQSEQKFNEAVTFKAKKKWYFNYARSYADARQYDRAAGIYQRLLTRFNHDKTAGLEYANMELYKRSNYARAEEITRREILDYHIDDKDAMLLLGDVFLEWATNSDATKFDDALYAYQDLMHMHGQTDLHLSRMLRYYMRTDQIPKVLELKSYFYPKMKKKQVMENKDMVELSGYLLDKMYGYLSPKNEYLRAYIEDVRDLLEMAVKACEKSKDQDSYPEAVYNYGRYFVETENPASAVTVLKTAADLLENAEKKSHKRTLRTINTYRLLGEIYSTDKKYLDAETMYADGLTLFEYEKKNNALEPDENVGLLYADMADIDYFLSGDYAAALRNYESAINNMNDTPSIRYRVGWIQYMNGNYSEALGSFIKVITDKPSEKNALFALGNTLAFRNSTSAAAGYYEKLIDELDLEIQRADVSLTRVQDIDQEELFTLYMKTTNNLGVALSQVAAQTSDSRMNARAISQFSNSIQAYDALHRNPETYIRLSGSNLAEMNLKYLTVPGSSYEPEYYSDLSRVLTDELMLRLANE